MDSLNIAIPVQVIRYLRDRSFNDNQPDYFVAEYLC